MITPFNPSVIARAIEVVRRSNSDTALLALLTPPSRGRRPSYNTTAFLVGSILAVQWKGSLVIRDIHRVLTERLPVDVQRELGVRALDVHGHERLTTEKDLYAIDEGDSVAPATKRSSDPDAWYGVKTRKDGKRETCWGYELHALVRAPDTPGQDGFIPLFETFEVTPAGMDIVSPSLGLLDRARTMGNTITELLADRHYSYKAEDRWYFQLLDRGIRQHVDMHPNDQGFRGYNGMKLAAGWTHCPCTPDRLGRIDSPSPNADAGIKKEFAELIDERQQYSMRASHASGKARVPGGSARRWMAESGALCERAPWKSPSSTACR